MFHVEHQNNFVLEIDSFSVIDHFKTKEVFKLKWNEELKCYETFPKPEEAEIQKYYSSSNYISHQSRMRSVKDLLYHWIRNYMFKTKLNWIKEEVNTGLHLLDVGCGVGEFINNANKVGFKAVGVEPNSKAREIATSKNLEVSEDITHFTNRTFDVVTLWHVLEHLHQPETFLKQIKSMMNPSGVVFIAVPNFKSYDANYYKEYWAAYDVPRHLYHFSRDSIQILAEKTNFELTKIHPLQFDSYYVSMLSEKYKNTNAGLGWLTQGWKSNQLAKQTGEWSSLVYVLKSTNKAK